ncbi:alkaline phosphatase D family protein [Pontimicrobium sp. SW4]|uniref:Alkaline phosphatase D family protein n=1 Tax=Pontimicrobium sp. SW4 TaxID=3153519 RepID=A0AAU7BWN6_9FLAO
MNRRTYIKTSILGSLLPTLDLYGFTKNLDAIWTTKTIDFSSDWHIWPDMKWVGPEYWGNRLQDWLIKNGKVICDVTDKNRTLHLLTTQKNANPSNIEASVDIELLNREIHHLNDGCIGFRFGAKGPFEDYRSAAVFGNGLDIGLTPKGRLVVGEKIFDTSFNQLPNSFSLHIKAKPEGIDKYNLTIEINLGDKDYFQQSDIIISSEQLAGNFALLANLADAKEIKSNPSIAFVDWKIKAEEAMEMTNQIYGPIYFAQYTLHQNKLKLTAQLSPIEAIKGHQVHLQLNIEGTWQTFKTTTLSHSGRAVNFIVDEWKYNEAIPYRVTVEIPLKDGLHRYIYEGSIAKEPTGSKSLKAGVFSCNFHYGFPDTDIVENVTKLDPDVILFLGDQFYEGTGGFGALYKGDFDKMCLDYLRKWMMFGWSYRELFRHKPCAIIPDDHDVYHGNVWGEEGKKADTNHGFGASAQDSGGYKMPAEWVNMVQFTQTSHLPDPYDSTPVKQNIGVYYTNWDYGGVSFAILEDRKFKSAPKHILPEEAQVSNGWILNDKFDIKKYAHLEADLLGKRQEEFLEQWVEKWSKGIVMKTVLSQTNFATIATLPEGAKTGAVIPSLYIPEKGEYIKGDKPTVDMDSNGWPKTKRDKAVSIIRKAFTFHIAGDQHLGSFSQYGIEHHGDSGYAFAGPALNNIWPRRFWPNVDTSNHTYENPAYTGDHEDGFGNKITVHAVANPHKIHKEPEVIHNRANGYGMVTFDKVNRTIKTECWPRFVDPTMRKSQYPGWPVTIHQLDNYGKEGKLWLPEFRVKGRQLPVLKIYNKDNNLIYALRIPTTFKPKVFEKGHYKVLIEVPETGFQKIYKKVKARSNQEKIINIDL